VALSGLRLRAGPVRSPAGVAYGKETEATLPSEIVTYFTCEKCFTEKPLGFSPRSWSRLEVGLDRHGVVVVWCVRHDQLVVRLDGGRN